jgi:hypothetical protein
MSTYTIVKSGIVSNIIDASAEFVEIYQPGAVRVDCLSPQPGIGWFYDGTSFTAPIRVTVASITAAHGEAIAPVTAVATGGTAPYSFSGENLPAGISISNAGAISGTIAGAGVYAATIRAADSDGHIGSVAVTITAV